MPAPKDLGQMWGDIQRDLAQLRQLIRNPFANTGLKVPGPGVLESDSYVPATAGFKLDGASGVAEFKDVILYDLPNSMLASPVVAGIGRKSASNFALSAGSLTEKAGTDLVVPDGCTQLLATVTGRLYVINPNTSGGADGTGTDAIYVAVVLGATASVATPTGISGSGGFATSNTSESFVFTGLTPGSTIRLGVYGCSRYASIAADAGNYISCAATLIWLR